MLRANLVAAISRSSLDRRATPVRIRLRMLLAKVERSCLGLRLAREQEQSNSLGAATKRCRDLGFHPRSVEDIRKLHNGRDIVEASSRLEWQVA